MPLLGILILAGLVYDGAVFYNRWDRNRQAAQERSEKEASHAQKTIDALGGGGLKIISFTVPREQSIVVQIPRYVTALPARKQSA